mmetsp:Transcript_11933/g.18970  ORF Transcript_11933/g.18970 Transcript_11933/m.18970 type:complete len:117 (-) Transcript_11933:153-503(-)
MTFDRNDTLFLTENVGRVRMITPKGEVSTIAGKRYVVKRDGHRYYLDGKRFRFFKILNPEDNPSEPYDAGWPNGAQIDGLGYEAKFHGPMGIVSGRDGCLYVADTGNSVIRKLTPV